MKRGFLIDCISYAAGEEGWYLADSDFEGIRDSHNLTDEEAVDAIQSSGFFNRLQNGFILNRTND